MFTEIPNGQPSAALGIELLSESGGRYRAKMVHGRLDLSGAELQFAPNVDAVSFAARAADLDVKLGGDAPTAGIYRVSLYVGTNTPAALTTLSIVLAWTDETTFRNATLVSSLDVSSGNAIATVSYVLRANGTDPIELQAALSSPGALYDLYAVLERLG